MKPDHDIFIIGAGFSGIGLAIRLKQAGYHRFLIADQHSGVGGTWWANRYPGCACDVQSHLYSLSFAPNPKWSRHFPPREEIQSHMEATVDRWDLRPHLRLNTTIEQAVWHEANQCWHITTKSGETFSPTILVGAMGGLARPKWPSISGLEGFSGRIIHSSEWPQDLSLANQRVAVIGTGASAIQFIPQITPEARQVFVFQRTPNWILPKPDRPISPRLQALYSKCPPLRLLTRFLLYTLLETRLPAFTRWPKLSYFHRKKAIGHLRRQIHDRALQQAMTPDYSMGCKRVLMSNDYYPCFNEDHVELITSPIQCVTSDGVMDASGRSYPCDVIVLGTGFQASSPISEGLIIGRDQQDIAHVWSEGPEAYKGTTIHGFPNFFTLLGPNTALGHNSVLLMIEGQLNYIMDALDILNRKSITTFEVTQQAQKQWNRRLSQKLNQTVWSQGGCHSWYLHPTSKKNTTLWPATTWRFKQLTRHFDLNAYHHN